MKVSVGQSSLLAEDHVEANAGEGSRPGESYDVAKLETKIDGLITLLYGFRRMLRPEADSASEAPPLPQGPERSEEQAFLDRVMRAIDEGLPDENFHVGALAARLAIGRSHLYRRLAASDHGSPAKLILERRLEHAAALLRAGLRPICEVADAVGFKNVSHFSQRFRQRFGVAPSRYRDRAEHDGLT